MNEKKYFVLKLIPPRPTFSQDMNEEERAIMQQHVVYWKGLMNEGIAIAFGPVLDPAGVYGLGIVEVNDEEHIRALTKDDPAVSSGLNKIEILPMLAVVKK